MAGLHGGEDEVLCSMAAQRDDPGNDATELQGTLSINHMRNRRSETPLQKAHNLDSRGESYSHYYGHNTIKFLIAVAPCRLIMLISQAYGAWRNKVSGEVTPLPVEPMGPRKI